MADVAILDAVALLRDMPELGLVRGQVGAVVDDAGGVEVLVEFTDADGRTIAMPSLPRIDLLALREAPIAAE